MKKKILVAPSILSADFAMLGQEVKRIEMAGADMVHVDVMDGHFVPNITIGPLVVKAIRKHTTLPLDVHLMLEEPHLFLNDFIKAGSDIITVHAEAYGESSKKQAVKKGKSRVITVLDREMITQVLRQIKASGKRAGLALNPDTPFCCIKEVLDQIDLVLIMSVHPGFGGQEFINMVLPKIQEARNFFSGDIEVDGGLKDSNVASVIDAGANIIVAGSYFFSSKDQKGAVKTLRQEN